jgi:hypothetical protein
MGVALGFQSHYALLYSAFNWGWRGRIAIGVPGWIVATYLLWHGMSILLIPECLQ